MKGRIYALWDVENDRVTANGATGVEEPLYYMWNGVEFVYFDAREGNNQTFPPDEIEMWTMRGRYQLRILEPVLNVDEWGRDV